MQAMTEQNENGHSVYQNLVSQTPFHCARFPLCQALRVEEALGKPRHHNSLLLTRYQQPWYSFMVAAHLASRRIICIVCGLNATLRDRPLRLDLWGEKSSYLAQAKTLPWSLAAQHPETPGGLVVPAQDESGGAAQAGTGRCRLTRGPLSRVEHVTPSIHPSFLPIFPPRAAGEGRRGRAVRPGHPRPPGRPGPHLEVG